MKAKKNEKKPSKTAQRDPNLDKNGRSVRVGCTVADDDNGGIVRFIERGKLVYADSKGDTWYAAAGDVVVVKDAERTSAGIRAPELMQSGQAALMLHSAVNLLWENVAYAHKRAPKNSGIAIDLKGAEHHLREASDFLHSLLGQNVDVAPDTPQECLAFGQALADEGLALGKALISD